MWAVIFVPANRLEVMESNDWCFSVLWCLQLVLTVERVLLIPVNLMFNNKIMLWKLKELLISWSEIRESSKRESEILWPRDENGGLRNPGSQATRNNEHVNKTVILLGGPTAGPLVAQLMSKMITYTIAIKDN
jgi:hypothetical protein